MSLAPAATLGRRAAALELAGAIGATTLIGLTIRLYFSAGPLGNDEMWSLANLRPIPHFWRILWGISHDNNHFLNSLWLYFVWPWSHNSTLARLPSILAGALTIPLMARLGAKRGPAAALAAAALTALSFFQFTYSVEARGYATATLALMAAYAEGERALDQPGSGVRWRLAAAAGLAFFSHLACGPVIVLYSLIAFGETMRRGAGFGRAVRATFALFWPAALAMTPTLLFVAAGYRVMGGFTIGFFTPFGASHTIAAAANLEMATFGLSPSSLPQIVFAMLALPPLILAAIFAFARPDRRIAYIVMIFSLPAAALILRLPNTHAPRYFFAASPFLLLLFAEAFDAGWRRAGAARALAVLALAASLSGDAAALARLRAGMEAPWTRALDVIAASGEPALAASFDFNVGRSVDHFNLDRGTALELVGKSTICARRPGWYIAELPDGGGAGPALEVEGEGCALRYVLVGVYDRDIPWQPVWGLYRRSGAAP
jgi:hypothetical protein